MAHHSRSKPARCLRASGPIGPGLPHATRRLVAYTSSGNTRVAEYASASFSASQSPWVIREFDAILRTGLSKSLFLLPPDHCILLHSGEQQTCYVDSCASAESIEAMLGDFASSIDRVMLVVPAAQRPPFCCCMRLQTDHTRGGPHAETQDIADGCGKRYIRSNYTTRTEPSGTMWRRIWPHLDFGAVPAD